MRHIKVTVSQTAKLKNRVTVKNQKIRTTAIIAVIDLKFDQYDFNIQLCVQKMQTERKANSVDPDQTVPSRSFLIWFITFSQMFLLENL